VRSRNQPRAGRTWASIPPLAVLVAAALVIGGVGATASAQTPPAPPGAQAQPPVDNVFPIPVPYEVSFSDDWHNCRGEGCSRQHKGNDILADDGTPAVAVESGTIVKVDNTGGGLGGLTVWLRGDSGVAYYYAHNSANLVAPGDRVSRGQTIATVGSTGNAAGGPAHIHFQINLCGELSSDEPCTVNPFPYLQGWAQGLVDGGTDGVGWFDPSTGGFGQRSDAGSPLPSIPVTLPPPPADPDDPVVGGPGSQDVLPLAGDWDGDGRDSVGTYQRGDATFHLRDDEGAELAPVPFGTPGRPDVWPLAGDFDGDGRDTVGLYQQADASFVVLVDAGVASAPVVLGTQGRTDALPVVGDWDGDGRDSVGLYQQADGTLSLLDDAGAPVDPTTVVTPTARPEGTAPTDAFPVAGDWDGDGRDSVGLMWRGAAMFDLPVPTPVDPAASRTVPTDVAPAPLPVAGDWNGRDLVTLDELRQIYGLLPDEAKVVEGLPALNAAMMRAGISTPARKAAFLATLRSESGFRFDVSEYGNESRYRGRGFIQLTGRSNYEAAGKFLGLDLLNDPDLATNGLVSPVVAAWYWTVARDINQAADKLDMAAVNIAIGFRPSLQRDMIRCADFLAALKFYSGGTAPEGVNCERTPESRTLAFSMSVPPAARQWLPGGSRPSGAPSGTIPKLDATTLPPTSAAPPTPPQTYVPAPGDPVAPPSSGPVPSAPPSTGGTAPTAPTAPTGPPPSSDPPTTDDPGTTTSSEPTTSSSDTTAPETTTTGSTPPNEPTTTSPVDPDESTTTTLFDGQYEGG
jgi:hypothetical protein